MQTNFFKCMPERKIPPGFKTLIISVSVDGKSAVQKYGEWTWNILSKKSLLNGKSFASGT